MCANRIPTTQHESSLNACHSNASSGAHRGMSNPGSRRRRRGSLLDGTRLSGHTAVSTNCAPHRYKAKPPRRGRQTKGGKESGVRQIGSTRDDCPINPKRSFLFTEGQTQNRSAILDVQTCCFGRKLRHCAAADSVKAGRYLCAIGSSVSTETCLESLCAFLDPATAPDSRSIDSEQGSLPRTRVAAAGPGDS